MVRIDRRDQQRELHLVLADDRGEGKYRGHAQAILFGTAAARRNWFRHNRSSRDLSRPPHHTKITGWTLAEYAVLHRQVHSMHRTCIHLRCSRDALLGFRGMGATR